MENRFRFRIWDKFCETWLTDFAINQDGEINKFLNSEEALKRRFVLMQCTGMKDDTGKLIYEGDIVEIWKMKGNIQKRMVVKWRDTQCSFRLYDLSAMGATPQKLLSPEKRSMGAVTSIKIIGNAYENPELLEDNK